MPTEKYFRWFLLIASLALLIAFIYPGAGADILLILIIVFAIAHFFLKEKVLLLFLAFRPLVDHWRDLPLLEIAKTKINLNSALAILLLAWTGWIIYKYRHKVLHTPLLIPLSIFSFFILASSLYSFYPITSLIETIKFWDIALIFITIYILAKNDIIKETEVVWAAYASALFPVLAGLYQLFGGFGITTFGIHGRIYGTFAHPNVFAFYLLFLLLIHWLYSSLTPLKFWTKYPPLKIITYITLTILLIFTYTRAGWIGLAAFLLIVGLLKYRRALIVSFISVGLLFAIFFPLNSFLIKNYNINLQKNNLIGRLTARSEEADSLAWRQSLVVESIPLIRRHLFFGYGYGTFPIIWEANRSNIHLYDDSAEAHNDYLRLALEVGLSGLAIYILMLTWLFITIIKPIHHESEQPRHLVFFASIIVFFLLSVTDNMLHHTPVMWWLWAIWGIWMADVS